MHEVHTLHSSVNHRHGTFHLSGFETKPCWATKTTTPSPSLTGSLIYLKNGEVTILPILNALLLWYSGLQPAFVLSLHRGPEGLSVSNSRAPAAAACWCPSAESGGSQGRKLYLSLQVSAHVWFISSSLCPWRITTRACRRGKAICTTMAQ